MSQRTFATLKALVSGSAAPLVAAAAAPEPAVPVAAPAAAAPAPAPAAPAGETMTLIEAAAIATEAEAVGHATGYAAANARMNAVLASDAGKANVSMAAFMLVNTAAPADAIVAQLATLPAGSAAPAAPAAAAPATPAERIAATTPTVDLGQAAHVAASNDDGSGKSEDIWAPVLGKDANGNLAAGGVGGFSMGKAPAGMEGMAHGC